MKKGDRWQRPEGAGKAPVLLVSGTRPEIIKLAPVLHALQDSAWARPYWLHTGQHGEMAEPMLQCFGIEPDYRFRRAGSSLLEFSTQCRLQLEQVLQVRRWAAVVVQGDTESAFLGALAGFYNQVPVAHVEAGLRTNDLRRPFPEEGLRQMISRIARLHLAPTQRAAAALRAEGVDAAHVAVTGNTVVDAQLWVREHHDIRRRVQGRGHLLVTMHRRENWGVDIEQVCSAIVEIAHEFTDLQVLFPVHLNPVVHDPVHRLLGGLPNVRLTAPLDYLQMQQALADAFVVLSDSGGLQEEAPTWRVPMLVLREETERPEVIEAGCAALVGTDRTLIASRLRELLATPGSHRRMQAGENPFGDGTAARQIARKLQSALLLDDVIPFDSGWQIELA